MFLVLGTATDAESKVIWHKAARLNLRLKAQKPLLLHNVLQSACPK